MPDYAPGVAISDNYAYVADRWSGLQVVDITYPHSPVIVGSVDTPDSASGIAVSDNYAYVADGASGLQILPTQCDVTSIDDVGTGTPSLPRAFRLSQNYPNPFNPLTTVEYAIPEGVGYVRVLVVIYDLRGRLVRRLVDRQQGAGQYRVHWNGNNERGQSLGSGVYLLTIKAGSFESRRKMVMVR